uniref:Hemin uptake protein HemP n=1 Tax=Schlesneria paludicola TaxID=360056 RepID=A0A7C4LPR5_9PLAN
MTCEPPPQPPENPPPPPSSRTEPVSELIIRSDELLRGHREVRIIHGTETYRLRLTRNGKLILHK